MGQRHKDLMDLETGLEVGTIVWGDLKPKESDSEVCPRRIYDLEVVNVVLVIDSFRPYFFHDHTVVGHGLVSLIRLKSKVLGFLSNTNHSDKTFTFFSLYITYKKSLQYEWGEYRLNRWIIFKSSELTILYLT